MKKILILLILSLNCIGPFKNLDGKKCEEERERHRRCVNFTILVCSSPGACLIYGILTPVIFCGDAAPSCRASSSSSNNNRNRDNGSSSSR